MIKRGAGRWVSQFCRIGSHHLLLYSYYKERRRDKDSDNNGYGKYVFTRYREKYEMKRYKY